MEEKIIEFQGKSYRAVFGGDQVGCRGCAAAEISAGCTAPGCGITELNRLYGEPCWRGPGHRYELVKDAPAAVWHGPWHRVDEATKLSNPKDLVGVRKAPMSTVSAAVMAEVGVAMHEGALKYGRHNYRAVGVRSSVYYDGTMRHLMAWWEGEDLDPDTADLDEQGQPIPDTGVHHVTKAITSLMVLRDAMLQGKCTDDRPPRSVPFYPRLNATAGKLIDRYGERNPRHYTITDTET